MKILAILISLIISTNSLAQDAVKIEKGEPAKFSGILLTKERAEKAMKAEKKSIVLSDLAITQEEITEYYKGQAREYRKKLRNEEFRSFWVGVGYFTLGVLVTGFAFKVTHEIDAL